MRKIIFLGGCRMDIIFEGVRPVSASPGGNMLNAAILTASAGIPTCYIGEAATDPTGDAVVGILAEAGVDTSCIDRYPDGATTIDILYGENDRQGTFYTKPPRESLVIRWPKVGADDIVVFGNWFALDPRTRGAVREFVEHAAGSHALLVYLPGFAPQLEPAITHVMTAILDNLELADIAVTFNDDPAHIFRAAGPEECYRRNTSFYADTLLHIDGPGRSVTLFNHDRQQTTSLPGETAPRLAEAGVLADFLEFLATAGTDDSRSTLQIINTWKPRR
ncbi:MAG: carbohydrate kinase family protein [Clostridium sp.]|nr:carbohydrate kinase family protein [Clostridium sp.]